MPYPNVEFDNLWDAKCLEKNRNIWGETLEQAAEIVANPRDIETLCFDSTNLNRVRQDLAIVTKKHLLKIEEEITEREGKCNAPGSTKEDLLDELKLITTMLK